MLFLFWGAPTTVEGIERAYRINHNIIRYLTVKRDEEECQGEKKEEQ